MIAFLHCLKAGRWKMEDGRWKMEDGRWKMEDGRWKMEDGRGRLMTSFPNFLGCWSFR
jgi:hypothetical protein